MCGLFLLSLQLGLFLLSLQSSLNTMLRNCQLSVYNVNISIIITSFPFSLTVRRIKLNQF